MTLIRKEPGVRLLENKQERRAAGLNSGPPQFRPPELHDTIRRFAI